MEHASGEDERTWRAALAQHRRAKDAAFRRDPHSPIPHGERAGFRGLAYYEPDPAFRFVVAPERLAAAKPVVMQTSDGDTREYVPAARLPFEVDGRKAAVVAYDQVDAWFVPFRDATSGKETYGAGRYLEVERGETVVLDFNAAYNPFCAYNDAYSCPFPPFDNWLDVPIRAGEKAYAKG